MKRLKDKLQLRNRAGRDERGLEAAADVLIWVMLLGFLLAIMQGAIWYHATNLAQAAATSAYQAASLYNASAGDGINAGHSTATQSGSILTDVEVSVSRTATQVTVTVTAHAPMLVPGVSNTIEKTVVGPVERWTP